MMQNKCLSRKKVVKVKCGGKDSRERYLIGIKGSKKRLGDDDAHFRSKPENNRGPSSEHTCT